MFHYIIYTSIID